MIINYPYNSLDLQLSKLPSKVCLLDHLTGFDQFGHNWILDKLNKYSQDNNIRTVVNYHQILDPEVKNNYANLELIFDFEPVRDSMWTPFLLYNQHPDINYRNFICSFNGSDHVSRKLLTAILERFGYFSPGYCSKNFVYTVDRLDGHITDFVANCDNFYRKFFITNNSDVFFNTVNSFGHVQYNHGQNIYNLESKLTQSFLHIVSETMATSYVPFVTEKFLYSIVTRGLFLAYAQPGWHDHVEKYYGFKKYTNLFDYRFDSIANPVERLIELMAMVSKFSRFSTDDWHDLYLLESDTIEFNYDWYFSKSYLEQIESFSA